jgi:hypothetical protein
MIEHTPEMSIIEQRLDKLERGNRRMKIVTTAMLLVVVGLVATGAAQTWSGQYVEATRYVLRDSHGRIRGQWVAQEDSSGLSLYDVQERPVMELLNATDQRAVKLSLISPKGVVSLWATPDDVGVIVRQANNNSGDRVFLGLQDVPAFRGDVDGPPFSTLRLNDNNGKEKVTFLTTSKGGFGLVRDDKGTPIWIMLKPPESK